MDDKFMYIPNDDTQNYLFCRLKLVVETFKHSTVWAIQSNPKFLSQRIRKRYHKSLGTSVINSPLSPLSLVLNTYVSMISWNIDWHVKL